MPKTDPWLTQEQEHAWRMWLKVNTELHAALARDLQSGSELSYSDFAVLVQLTDHPEGRIRVTDLAVVLHWDRSRVSHHVKRMESRGLVARSECPTDGRVAYLSITDQGRVAIAQAAPAHAALVGELVFHGMSADDLAHFVATNAAIAKRLTELEARSATEERDTISSYREDR